MTNKKDTIEINKSTLFNGAFIVLFIAFIASILTGGFGYGSDNAGAGAAIAVPSAPSAPSAAAKVDMKDLIDDDDIFGDKDAPVTIVEFSDFECPFCTRAYDDALSQVKSEYVEKGLVNIVYRDFPLGFHQNAQKSAEAAECAGEQGEYYAMHDLLFENGVEGGVATYKAYAKTIGLDTTEFDECLDSGAMAKEVAKDMADGQAAGVQGTPAFFIDGELISGAQPFTVFKQAIDAALA